MNHQEVLQWYCTSLCNVPVVTLYPVGNRHADFFLLVFYYLQLKFLADLSSVLALAL